MSVLMFGAAAVQAQTPHPAEALIDRSAQTEGSRPDESHRLANDALTLMGQRPEPDLALRARTLLSSYLSERDRQQPNEKWRQPTCCCPS